MQLKMLQNVVIVGASGRIGGAFARALVEGGNHQVTALTREDSKSTIPEGVRAVKVNYDDEKSLVRALEGQQFLVIALAARAPEELHKKITDAAGKAGVPYIMPNCFGYPLASYSGPNAGGFGKLVKQRVESSKNGVSSLVRLSCGYWYEWSLATGEQWFGFNIKDRKVTFFDEGTRVITTSTWLQCGRALAALLSLPEKDASPCLNDYVNGECLISSFRVSQRDMLDSLHRVLGTTDADWEIKHETSEQRIKDGAEELARGIFTGFTKQIYALVFRKENELSDFAGVMKTANSILGLPQENLDEATKRTVEMVESGWNPFGM